MTGDFRNSEQGFTLIELLIAIMLSGLILSALATGFVTTLRGTKNVHDTFVQTHDAQLLATSFTSDVQSANPATIDTGVTACPGTYPGTNLVRLQWTESDGSVLKAFSASYRIVPPTPAPTPPATAPSQLVRDFCWGSGTVSTAPSVILAGAGATVRSRVVSRDLANSQVAAVVTPTTVDLVLAAFQGGPTVPAYSYKFSANMRTPAVTVPFVVQFGPGPGPGPGPGTPTAGMPLSIQITAKDAAGATDNTYTGDKAVLFSGPGNSPNGSTPTYPASVSFTNGVGTASITLVKAETAPLTVSQGFHVTPAPFSVTVVGGSPALAFSVCPPNVRVSTTTAETVTRSTDAYGNALTSSAASAITVNLSKTAGGGTLPTPATATISANQPASPPFNYTTPAALGTAVTLTGHTTTTTPAYSDATCAFTTGNPVFLIPTPASVAAGVPFDLSITATNDGTNPDTGYDGTMTLTFAGPANSPNGTAPVYPATVDFTEGVGTATLTLHKAGATTLSVSDSQHSKAVTFTVAPASTTLSFSDCPPIDTRKSKTSTENVLRLDAYGNAGTTDVAVTLSATNGGSFSPASVTVLANATSASSTLNNPGTKPTTVVMTAHAPGFSDVTCSFTTS